MTAEYKALTFINLPFTDWSFSPGDIIDHSAIEEYATNAAAAMPTPSEEFGGHVPTADEMIDHFIEYGSISEDLDAPLHPDHIPPDPSIPTLALLIEQAKASVAFMEENGQEVPEELRTFAETDYRHVVAEGDSGTGGDLHAS